MVKCCYDVEKLLDSDKYKYIEDDLFYQNKILIIDGKKYGVVVYTGCSDYVHHYTNIIKSKYGDCKLLDFKWDFDNICTALYLIGRYRLKTLSEVFKAVADSNYIKKEPISISHRNCQLFKKFYNESKYFIDGEWYAVFCNGSNGRDNNVIMPMKECIALLSELSAGKDKASTIIDCYLDTTDDVYDWLFWLR